MPARGGHPHHPRAQPHQQRFNTRARARRAPPANNLQWRGCRVSTHVPARGGHQPIRTHDRQLARFNTRARARRALGRALGLIHAAHVSTHVPARGGHVRLSWMSAIEDLFQHTCPREAGTFASVLAGSFLSAFQHTCPREAGTCAYFCSFLGLGCFNTRARARRAPLVAPSAVINWLFQHTCPREAGTNAGCLFKSYPLVSTHVPARGGHLNHSDIACRNRSFNTRARARRALLAFFSF